MSEEKPAYAGRASAPYQCRYCGATVALRELHTIYDCRTQLQAEVARLQAASTVAGDAMSGGKPDYAADMAKFEEQKARMRRELASPDPDIRQAGRARQQRLAQEQQLQAYPALLEWVRTAPLYHAPTCPFDGQDVRETGDYGCQCAVGPAAIRRRELLREAKGE